MKQNDTLWLVIDRGIRSVPAGRPEIAQHFSAEMKCGKPPSPVRDDRSRGRLALSSLPGLCFWPTPYPALKCWAIVGQPSGRAHRANTPVRSETIPVAHASASNRFHHPHNATPPPLPHVASGNAFAPPFRPRPFPLPGLGFPYFPASATESGAPPVPRLSSRI